MIRTVRTRGWLVLTALATVTLGLGLRFGLPLLGDHWALGFGADLAGSIMYGALWFILLRICFPAARPILVAAGAFLVSTAIELFQLTDIPARLAHLWGPLALIFGTTFNAADIAGYLIGVVISFVCLSATVKPRQARGD